MIAAPLLRPRSSKDALLLTALGEVRFRREGSVSSVGGTSVQSYPRNGAGMKVPSGKQQAFA